MSIGLSEGLLSFGLSGSISASRGLGAIREAQRKIVASGGVKTSARVGQMGLLSIFP